MKIYISKINKKDNSNIFYYQYKADKKTVALSIWLELLEPRYILNKQGFLNAWKLYTNSKLEIVVDNTFQIEVLLNYLTFDKAVKFELFLEKIYSGFTFIVFVP